METKLRWGILGYARIAQNAFIPALKKVRNGELLGIASRDSGKLAESRKRFGTPRTYVGYEDLLDDPDIQAVYVPLPNGLHKEWVICCAERGKHVLCEKPLALTARECQEMAEACRQNGVHLAEAFMYRYTPRMRKVRDILADGSLGQVKAIHASFSFLLDRDDDYRWDPSQGGGALYDVGCYPLNFVGMVMGADPVSVQMEYEPYRGVDRALSAVLKYDNGVIATVHSGMNAAFQNHSTIVGTQGVLEIPQPFLGRTSYIALTTDGRTRKIRIAWRDPYQKEIESFGDTVLKGDPPVMALDETVRNMRIIDSMIAKIRVDAGMEMLK